MLHTQLMYRDLGKKRLVVGRLSVEVTIAEEEYPAYVLKC